MAKTGSKQKPGGRGRKQIYGATRRAIKPRRFSFKREAEWMTVMNLAPFFIGVVLALIFWFTR